MYLPPKFEEYMHPYAYCNIIHNDQGIKTTNVFFDRWLDEEDVVHRYNGILLSHRKILSTAICNNMDGSWEYHAKWNAKSDRKSQEPYDFTYMWDIKLKATNEQTIETNKQTKTPHRHRQQ